MLAYCFTVSWLVASPVLPADSAEIHPAHGILQLTVKDPSGSIQPFPCDGLLLTPDTVLVQATCFEDVFVLLKEDPHGLEGVFTLDGHGSDTLAAMRAVDIKPGYRPIQCGSADFAGPCQKARDFCYHRFDNEPLARNACLFDAAFYARTFVEGPVSNLALVYLNKGLYAERPGDVASPAHGHDTTQFVLLNSEGAPAVIDAEYVGDEIVEVTHQQDDRYSRGMFVGRSDGAYGLFAIPSHFASLSWDPRVPVNFAFTRIDTALPWLVSAMDAACIAGRRVQCSSISVLEPDAPAPEPMPKPNPEPSPDQPRPDVPVPSPKRPQPPKAPNVPKKPAEPQEPTDDTRPETTRPSDPPKVGGPVTASRPHSGEIFEVPHDAPRTSPSRGCAQTDVGLPLAALLPLWVHRLLSTRGFGSRGCRCLRCRPNR